MRELGLKNESYDSKEVKKLPDSENPLDKINEICRLLQMFLHAHAGFIRSDLQDYLNVFSVIMNPPKNKYQKLEMLFNRAMVFPVLLRYRMETPHSSV